MSTPDDFSRRFDAVTPDASEYAVDDPDLATRTFPLYAMDSEIPLFRDICRYEVTRRQFQRRDGDGGEGEGEDGRGGKDDDDDDDDDDEDGEGRSETNANAVNARTNAVVGDRIDVL